MAGNVWEWCRDWYGPYPAEEQQDPIGPSRGTNRLLRGGGFDNHPSFLRAACRVVLPEFGGHLGFRCVVVGAGGQD
jgi:formylglycine-generating enzyme required for sulfatase activity